MKRLLFLFSILTVTGFHGEARAQSSRPGQQAEDLEVHPAPGALTAPAVAPRPCLGPECDLAWLSRRELRRRLVDPDALHRSGRNRRIAGGILLGIGTTMIVGAAAIAVLNAREGHGSDGRADMGYMIATLVGLPGLGLVGGGTATLVSGFRQEARARRQEQQALMSGRSMTLGWAGSF